MFSASDKSLQERQVVVHQTADGHGATSPASADVAEQVQTWHGSNGVNAHLPLNTMAGGPFQIGTEPIAVHCSTDVTAG